MANYNKGASWLEQQKKDKKRRETNPTMREAAKASRVQYTLPEYKGRSDVADTKSYKWETEILKDVKGMGRSYNDKFSGLTKSWGMSDTDAREFRRYMDFQEDSKQKIRTNKDGSMHGSASAHLGQGASLVDDNLNKLIGGVEKKTTQQYKAHLDAQIAEATRTDKVNQAKSGQEREGFFSKVDDTLNRFSRSVNDNFLPKSVIDHMAKNDQKAIDKQLASDDEKQFKKGLKNQKTVNAINSQAVTGLEKGAEIGGDVLAEILKYIPAYKGVNALSKATKFAPKSKIANDLVRGGAAGFAVGNANATLQQLNDPNATKGDYASRVALETLLAGGGDAAGGAILRNLNLKGQAGQLLDDLGGKQLTEEQMKVVAQAMELKPSGNPANVLAPTPTPSIPNAAVTGNNILDDMLGPNRSTPTQEPTAAQPEPQPNKVDDWLDFAMQGKNQPKARGAVTPIDNLSRGDREVLGKQADTILGRSDALVGKPNDYYGQRLLEVQQKMKNAQTPEAMRNLEETQKAYDIRKAEEDAFVQERMAPFNDMQQRSAQAESEWGPVKQLQDEAKRVQKAYGKLYIPEGNQADWSGEVPNRFRAGKNNNQAIDIYKFADDEGFNSVDEAVQYLKNLDEAAKTKLNDLRPSDHMNINADQYDELVKAARDEFAASDTGKGLDTYLADLLDTQNSIDTDIDSLYRSANDGSLPESFDELVKLNELEVNASNAPESEKDLFLMLRRDEELKKATQMFNRSTRGNVPEVQASAPAPVAETAPVQTNPLEELMNSLAPKPKQSIDEVLRSIEGQPTPEPETTAPLKGGDGLLRSNLQAFNEPSTNPLVNTSEGVPSFSSIESVRNPFVRAKDKIYKDYVNRSHNFKVAEIQALEKRIAEASGDEAVALGKELKRVKKTTSEADKALQIESASGTRTINFLNNHFTNLSKSLGKGATDKEVAEATQYLMSKNLQWQRDMGRVSDDHAIAQGWDWGRVNQEVAVGDQNPAFKSYQASFKEMTQELLNERLTYGLIDDAAHKALSENPYYIPMERDFSYLKDNIDKSMGLGQSSNKRSIDNYELHNLGSGDLKAFYKNPLETITTSAHTVFRNTFKSDTGEQLAKLADLDKEDMFVKTLTEAQAKENPSNVYEYFQNGEKKYLRLQDDLMKTIKENEEAADLGVLGKMTQLFARLKTSSLEYQSAAVPRDMAQSYMTSQAGPIEFFVEAFKAATSKNKSAKDLGAYFEKAYSDTTGGIDPKEVTNAFAAQNPNFSVVNGKDKTSLKKLGSMMVKIGKLPFKPGQKIGQFTDELPRSVETQIVAKKFQPKMDEINGQIKALEDEIASVPQSNDPFDPALQGVDNKAQELTDLKLQQRSLVRDMKREQTYRGLDVINYNRGGSGKFAKWIRQNIIFANTTTQSKDKMIRAFRESPGNFITKAAIVAAPFVTAQQIMHNNMSAEDKDVYDGLPDYMKTNNYIYVHEGDVIALPKVHELALITNPIEASLKGESLDDSARMAAKELLPYQTGMAAQALVPGEDGISLENAQLPSSVFSPGIDTLANQKLGFNQKPISYSANFQQDKSERKANDWTLEGLKELVGDSPSADRLEYLIKQYGGDAGKYGAHGGDYLDSLRTGSNKNNRLDLMLQNLNPLQDRYYTDKNRTFKSPPQETKKK
jgi:hypothetical protein